MSNRYTDELELAVCAAGKAGDLIREKISRHNVTEVKSCLSDLVTEVDRQSEDIIVGLLRENFPTYFIVGEESGDSPGDSGAKMTWHIDPLDGTTNFVFGLHFCAVSIALLEYGLPVLGVVHDPFREEIFTAVRGSGAFLNGQKIKIGSDIDTLERSLLVTGYPGNIALRPRMHRVNYRRVIDRCNNLRALGSAALELAYVACGRLTGFWEVSLRSWDVAAGMLLVEEAGGRVSDLAGKPLAITDYVDIAASNGLIHDELLNCLEWEGDSTGNYHGL